MCCLVRERTFGVAQAVGKGRENWIESKPADGRQCHSEWSKSVLPRGDGWIMVGRAWAARDFLAELPLWASDYLFRFRLCERTAFVLNFGHGHRV